MTISEVESALVRHEAVAEPAVVGYPHDIKGEGIYVFVILKGRQCAHRRAGENLVAHVRKVIDPLSTPDKLQFAPGLPKTRSGKILRRILRKISQGQIDELGDTTTLADPSVVDNLVRERL